MTSSLFHLFVYRTHYFTGFSVWKHPIFFNSLNDEHVEVEESILKFRCGRSDIEDLAFGVLCLRELGKAEL